MSMRQNPYKTKSMGEGGVRSSWRKYRVLMYGNQPSWKVCYSEIVSLVCGSMPGVLGLVLRRVFFPLLFRTCGARPVFGRGLVLRHAHKIELGANVILDDYVVLDAKGEGNQGVWLGDDVYLGRNTFVYCKGGNIRLHNSVNVSSNCQVVSSNDLEVGAGTVVGAYSYLLSGGAYDLTSPVPFAQQSGMETKGPLRIGANCWLGARITVLDAASIGDHCVVGAGSVVNKPLPPGVLAVGVPARVRRSRELPGRGSDEPRGGRE